MPADAFDGGADVAAADSLHHGAQRNLFGSREELQRGAPPPPPAGGPADPALSGKLVNDI
ncbi:hypothetical protein D3C76_1573720 [compost metagenome]